MPLNSIFKEDNGKLSAKRVVGVLGFLLVNILVLLEKGSDTVIIGMLTTYAALLGVTAFRKVSEVYSNYRAEKMDKEKKNCNDESINK